MSLFSSSSPPILFILSCSAKLHNMVRYKPQKVTKRKRTKRRTKDLDQIWDELHNPHQNTQLKKIIRKKNVKMDLPGFGKFYCAVCEYVSLSHSQEPPLHTSKEKTSPFHNSHILLAFLFFLETVVIL